MNKTSLKKARSSAKNTRVSAKKPAKAKSARRLSASKPVRGASKVSAKAAIRKTAIGKSSIGKLPPAKSTAKTVRSIAEAMKAAKVAHSNGIKARMVASPAVQPAAAPEIPVKAHKYQLGQSVYYNAPTFGRAPAAGNFTVVKLLPSEGDEHQYRIKSNGEAFERVAKESQLDVT